MSGDIPSGMSPLVFHLPGDGSLPLPLPRVQLRQPCVRLRHVGAGSVVETEPTGGATALRPQGACAEAQAAATRIPV